MKPNNNLLTQKDGGEENIITEIKNDIKNKECNDIGKRWKRKCPDCKNTIIYTKYNSYRKSKKRHSFCKSCSKIGKRNSFFGRRHTKENLKLYSIRSAGKNNPMYGIGGMTGKKQTEYQKRNQSRLMKQKWKNLRKKPRSKFQEYRDSVDCLTRKQPIHLLENFEKRGRAGVDGAYHLDHIISVWYGYHNDIPREVISNIKNLKFIPWLENQKKWCK